MIDPTRPYDVVDALSQSVHILLSDGECCKTGYLIICQSTGELICIAPTLEFADLIVTKLSANIPQNAFRSN